MTDMYKSINTGNIHIPSRGISLEEIAELTS